MASHSVRPNGHWWCFCKGTTGKRHTVRMGKVSRRQADEAKLRISQLEQDHRTGQRPDRVTAAWLDGLSDELHARVAASGLVSHRPGNDRRSRQRGLGKKPGAAPGTLGYLLERFPESIEVKDSSRTNIAKVAENLIRYYGSERQLSSITAGDADEFQVWIAANGRKKSDEPLARATVGRRVQEAKRMFRYAVRKEWLAKNPFSHIKSRCEINRSNEVYIRSRLIDELIEIETDPEMRLKLAMARYMGLRHDSEFRPLTWASVDWEAGYLRVESPKTERYTDGDLRDTPIHDKVRPLLDELWEAAPPGSTLIFPRLSAVNASASTDRLQRLCRWVGVPLWARAWNNLRASCETDLIREGSHDIFTTAAWMGHAPEVALRHYNRVAKERTGRGTADLPPGYRRRPSKFTSGLVGRSAPPSKAK